MIVRYLKKEERIKRYGDKMTKDEGNGIKQDTDYVVVSVEYVPELARVSQTTVRYWLITDYGVLTPCEAYNFKIVDPYLPCNWIIDVNADSVDLADPKWLQPSYVSQYYDDDIITAEYDKVIKKIFNESVNAATKRGIKLNLSVKAYKG